jgi:hypothetical protein
MTKKIISLIIAVVISLSLFACENTQKVSTVANLENVSSITVTLNPPEGSVTLTDEQVEEVITRLSSISLGEKDNSYQELNGQWVQFDITKEDGSVLSIAEFAPYIVIDGVGYKGEQKECEMLNEFANELLK